MIDTQNANDAAAPVPPVQPVQPATPAVVPATVPPPVQDEQTVCEESWYKKMWRPMLAGTYILLVIFDFLIMPIVIEVANTRESSNAQAVELALKFKDPTSQIQALKTFAENRVWSPLTLMGGGMFHVAFGALLTGAAVTRGMEKKEHASNGVVLR